MTEAGSTEDNRTAKAHPVLVALDAALSSVSGTLHDLAGLEPALAGLAKITATDLPALSRADLTASDLDLARLVAQKMRGLEQNLQVRGSILTGFSLKLKELIEG